jgi:hypothetical protein
MLQPRVHRDAVVSLAAATKAGIFEFRITIQQERPALQLICYQPRMVYLFHAVLYLCRKIAETQYPTV